MKLIVGIGNPGKEYENTRHNIGFIAIDQIAKKHRLDFSEKKFNSVYTSVRINGERVILMKPETYVNLSGSAVLSMMNYFNIDKEDILIIYDDIALPLGKIRVRFKGSAGGHNGLINIIKYLKTQDFKRMRIGIGSNAKIEKKNWVLGRFSNQESKELENPLKLIESVPEDFINMSFSDFMNKYNKEQ